MSGSGGTAAARSRASTSCHPDRSAGVSPRPAPQPAAEMLDGLRGEEQTARVWVRRQAPRGRAEWLSRSLPEGPCPHRLRGWVGVVACTARAEFPPQLQAVAPTSAQKNAVLPWDLRPAATPPHIKKGPTPKLCYPCLAGVRYRRRSSLSVQLYPKADSPPA
jgi:hypothetical protein